MVDYGQGNVSKIGIVKPKHVIAVVEASVIHQKYQLV